MRPEERVLREVFDDLGGEAFEEPPKTGTEYVDSAFIVAALKQAIRDLVTKQIEAARRGEES
jgi:hypothetical protein